MFPQSKKDPNPYFLSEAECRLIRGSVPPVHECRVLAWPVEKKPVQSVAMGRAAVVPMEAA